MGGNKVEQEIKVGDRVVGIGDFQMKNIDGEKGTVMYVNDKWVKVNYDNDIEGWENEDLGIAKGHGWGCPIANLRRITEDKPAPSPAWAIHITPNGNATHAVFKQGKHLTGHASALCSPRDTYDATTGAVWAFLRLPGMEAATRRVLAEMDGAKVEAEEPTRGMTAEECKVGMKVKFTDADKHKENPEYYPAVGTVGEVVGIEEDSAKVQWPKGSTSGVDCWYARYERIEPVEPVTVADVADEPAPVPQPMYKPGDRVMIVDKWGPGCRQACFREMDKWLGKIMTIRGAEKDTAGFLVYRMAEDKEKRFSGWYWYPAAIAGKVGESRKEK